MIKILMSELDFDYELSALARSFFPGQAVKAEALATKDCGISKPACKADIPGPDSIEIKIILSQFNIAVCALTCSFSVYNEASVTGDGDWHKRIDKMAHPYRTYYKNILKKLVFTVLKDFPEEMLPGGILKCIPAWGTMTGVRPVKIVMDEILKGKKNEEIKDILDGTYCLSMDRAEFAIQIAQREAEILKKEDYGSGYSLYIGIPFCPTSCLYCSFTSYPFKEDLAEAYLKALAKEMEYSSQISGKRKLSCVYIGGGTPVSLTPPQLDRLLSDLTKYFPVNKCIEFTVEAGRPDSITDEKLRILKDYGVLRVSVNPQTMQQKTLGAIGRRHTVQQAEEAFLLARKTGFGNINMDLITGLPGEDENDFADTLSQIKRLKPDSLSIHSLVIKRASKLREKLKEYKYTETSSMSRMENMFNMGREFARENGYIPYYMYRQKNSQGFYGSTGQENTGYAVCGKECLYNILIMEEKQTILALGAGASTKLYHKETGQVERVENVKDVSTYIQKIDEMTRRKEKLFKGLGSL